MWDGVTPSADVEKTANSAVFCFFSVLVLAVPIFGRTFVMPMPMRHLGSKMRVGNAPDQTNIAKGIMKKNGHCVCKTIVLICFWMGVMNTFAQKPRFAGRLKAAIEAVQREADKDPGTFKAGVARLEKDWGGEPNAVERAVAHAMLGSCYREMRWTHISDFDGETRADYAQKMREHFAEAVADMDALASAKADGFAALLTRGKDSDIYGGDMLAVMVSFVDEQAGLEPAETAGLYDRAMHVYRRRGNRAAYANMKMGWLDAKQRVAKRDGRQSMAQHRDSLYALLQEVADTEVGADVALRYENELDDRDESVGFLRWALAHVAPSRRRGDLQGRLDGLLTPSATVQTDEAKLPGKPFGVMVKMWNCEQAELVVRRFVGWRKEKNGSREPLLTGAVVNRCTVSLPTDSVSEARKTQGLPPEGQGLGELTLPTGLFVVEARGFGQRSVQVERVSSVRLLTTDSQAGVKRVYVLDSETGRPVKGARVQARERVSDLQNYSLDIDELKVDALTGDDGYVDVPARMWVRAVRSDDDYTAWSSVYASLGGNNNGPQRVLRAQVMTDRSIYRPGQKVMGSVVVYAQLGDSLQVCDAMPLRLRLTDAEGNELYSSDSLKTNEWGTAAFEALLPAGMSVGRCNVMVENRPERLQGSGSFRVEEYKRPTFEVTFDEHQGGQRMETVQVKGTAMMLAGVPVQGGRVHYTVESGTTSFRWWGTPDWNVVATGELTTDDEGRFCIPVTLSDDFLTREEGDGHDLLVWRVSVEVTDQAGESHEAATTLSSSRHEFVLDVEVDRMQNLGDEPAFVVNARQANGSPAHVSGRYELLLGDQMVGQGTFVAGDSVSLPQGLLPGARYAIRVTATDSKGNMEQCGNEGECTFVAYDSRLRVTDFDRMGKDEKRRAEGLPMTDCLHAGQSTYVEGGDVDFYFSTQATDAYILYNVYNRDGLLEEHAAVTDGTMKRVRLRHRAEWGDAIRVVVSYVRDGRAWKQDVSFTRREPEKQLKLEWATFRDHLQPGQQETWTLRVTDHKGQRVSGAELMAVLYDAALDRVYRHDWNFSLSFNRWRPAVNVQLLGTGYWSGMHLWGKTDGGKYYVREYDELNGFVHDRYISMDRRMYKSARAGVVMSMAAAPMADMNMAMENVAADAMTEERAVPQQLAEVSVGRQAAGQDFSQATLRSDFSETAFFMPHLVSDTEGNVEIQFTLPESLTEWRLMGFAHTKDVDYGLIKADAVARKAFMLRPNMPRFVRWGDRAVVASAVVNQSEKPLSGAVRMRLLDAATGNVVASEEKPFEVEAGKTVNVDFGFDVSDEWKDLECEVVAVSGGVSDGERHLLPVLSTQQEVVETVPFYLQGQADGTTVVKEVDLSGLFNRNAATATHRTLQVEYTDNPVWMCIEALRGVTNPEHDNAIDFAVSLCANSRLADLMRTFPVLERYEQADSLRQRATVAESKLADLQKEDGGWSWFSGMNSNYYVTLAVCERLVQMSAPTDRTKAMLAKGMAFLDRHEWEAYRQRQKVKAKVCSSNSELRYLYLSAQQPDRQVSKEVRQMREHYLSAVEKRPRDLTIYGVAHAAYALRSFGHVKAADRFVDFLKAYTVEKPGQGRFYATDAAYYSWMDYRIPTQVAAMKAIRQQNRADGYLNDMLLWLLTQKQVQKWDNPMNTMDVAELLLQVSPAETFHASQRPVLTVDGQPLLQLDYGTLNTERERMEGRESQLVLEGNVLAQVPAESLQGGVRQLVVQKATPGLSWGAAYAVFTEDVGRLDASSTQELAVRRKLYVQRAGSDEWKEYGEGVRLNVGDKVRIRHIVTADRDMDFVRVSAQHPACLEPIRQLSGYQRLGGRGGYLSLHDARFDLFFDWFTRGTTTVDMDYYVARAGEYEVGLSSVECVYAKQFGGHTGGMRIVADTGK